MRLGPAVVSIALLAAMAGAVPAGAVPNPAFDLRAPQPCVAGECSAFLTYGVVGLVNAVKVEVDWDTRNSPGGFQPDDVLSCAPPLPEDLGYAEPCEAESPTFQQPGTALVAVRVTDTVDGTQATASRPVAVTAPPRSKVTVPNQRGSTPDLCARASRACSAARATAAGRPAGARRSRTTVGPR